MSLSEIRGYFETEELELLAVTEAAPDEAAEYGYAQWLSRGRAGSMSYMHRHREAKYRPASMLPGARSIVLVGLGHFQHRPHGRGEGKDSGRPQGDGEKKASDSPRGLVARYAWGRDYHKVLGKRLKRICRAMEEAFPEHRFRSFTDATPLSERHYGARAGMGIRGRNTLLIHPRLGSWFFLGEILTTLHLVPTEAQTEGLTGCPRHCTRCIDVCPTEALTGPHEIDASRCISYLTIEHKGVIDEELMSKMGAWVFGCDLCQEVCPLNAAAHPTRVTDFRNHIAGENIPLEELLNLRTDEEVRRRFAGSPLLRARRRGLVRNACIAAANAGAAELLETIEALTADADHVVSFTARWAAARLRGRPAEM
ncbi:MAG: tRNA epoxyqueuosine(34) reductase QueG [Spirochaetaceae bacterium]